MLSKHVWIDEMRFAPTRASGFVGGVWSTYAGKIAKDAYLEVAFDSSGSGFCRLYAEKLGMPTRDMVAEALGREDREGIQADPRRGACPQSPSEEIRARGRLVQIRPGG